MEFVEQFLHKGTMLTKHLLQFQRWNLLTDGRKDASILHYFIYVYIETPGKPGGTEINWDKSTSDLM
jgi:hypothetical protein